MKSMKIKKRVLLISIIITISSTIITGIGYSHIDLNDSSLMSIRGGDIISQYTQKPKTSASTSNYNNLESIFSQKMSDYSSLGYFPQTYVPSLQATYYALYILDALGKLDTINQTRMLNYILSHYNNDSHVFMDKYAYRYLDSDFPNFYYPFTSVLQVNCYALLSLDILGNLRMIDKQESIDFIWSCFNPEGAENGFIGRPYDPNLSNGFRTATMDNGFYAITTLDLLMEDWSGYSTEKTKIINFINSLQSEVASIDYFGGFMNDANMSINTLMMFNEINMLASYYSVSSLNIFDLVDTIQISNFQDYLTNLYNNVDHSFQMFYGGGKMINLVATALGLELSNLTSFTNFNRNEAIDFILTNRNSIGNWDASTYYDYHELIDTFQIVRSLKEVGVIDQMTSQEKDDITDSLELYKQFKGYSLLSNDYMSLNLIYSTINSFNIFDRISDLDITTLYNLITENYKGDINNFGFLASTNMHEEYIRFRSRPIEYYSYGQHKYSSEVGSIFSHKITYMALESLLKIYKLDDFSIEVDLMDIANNIMDSQFLEYHYDNFGAFLQFEKFGSPEYQNNFIFFENSYYAIKSLELIVDHLDLGSFVNLSFNKVALHGYIERNICETDSVLYLDPQYTTNIQITMEYTYYMIYLLKALDLFNLNTQKIREFVVRNLDYDNINNLYYSYKISEILDLRINFDFDLTQQLVQTIFLDEINDFFVSTKFQEIDQEIFRWVCEMAMNSELKIKSDFENTILLGDINTLTTSFSNMIYPEYGSDITVKFESDQLGVIELERQFNSTFQINLLVPEDSNNFPYINGTLKVYKMSKVIGQSQIIFYTNISQTVSSWYRRDGNTIDFEINFTRALSSGNQPVYNSKLYAGVYKDEIYLETLNFSKIDYFDYSKFNLNYEFNGSGTYNYIISLVDEFYPDGWWLLSVQHTVSPPSPPLFELNGPILAFISLGSSVSIVGITTYSGNKLKNRKKNRVKKTEKNSKEQQQNKSAHEVNEDIENTFFEIWD